MDNRKSLTPARAANKINRIIDRFIDAHGGNRFPIDIDKLALGAAELFQWKDPITKITEASISRFEGMLSSNEDSTKWMITYNNSLKSPGRIRFTKAHELGHYILHRKLRNEFICSKNDMLNWFNEESIESEADLFASYLLMPLNDFREQAQGDINLDCLSHCADRYGVSLAAAILKWLSYTDEKALLIMSTDGFMNWASSSKPAMKSGAFFRTRKNTIPVPEASLTANDEVAIERIGVQMPAKIWFPHADSDSPLLEMKLYSDQYDCTLSLLLLPKYTDFWAPKD